MTAKQELLHLPDPTMKGTMSVEEAISKRRSIRNYRKESIDLEELSQLLWAGQGLSGKGSARTSPSAGGLCPTELFVQVTSVTGLEKGIYRYDSDNHALILSLPGDQREQLTEASLQQECILTSAASIIITADVSKTSWKYGDRAERYIYMEAGHVSENIYLQATAINLGTVAVGAFYDDRVKAVLQLPNKLHPLYIMPVGRP